MEESNTSMLKSPFMAKRHAAIAGTWDGRKIAIQLERAKINR